MTRTILQFTLQGRTFGVWENDVSSVVRGQPLHHLPLSPDCVAGMTLIDDRGTTVIDTGVCIGMAAQENGARASFLLVGDDGKRTGYRVEGSVDTVACEDDRVLPLPVGIQTEVLRSCVVLGDAVIPVIEIGRLQERIAKGIIDVPGSVEPPVAVNRQDRPGDAVRVLSLGAERFCINGTGSVLVAAAQARIREIPAAGGRSNRVLHHDGTIIPLLPVTEHLGLADRDAPGGVVIVEQGGSSYGIAVTADHGILEGDAFAIRSMPPIVRNGSIRDAVVVDGEVVPRIDLADVINGKISKDADEPLADRYRPAAVFSSLFRKENVGVTEVALFGGKHGLPQEEVKEILPYRTPRAVPLAPAIVTGVIERDGKVLPVLDLAAIFGKRSPVDRGWNLVRMENGDFEALVAVEKVLGEKMLSPDVQRQVPIVLPYDVLYGCYLDENAVRLILNVQSLTVHFEKTTIREFMTTLGPAAAESAEATEETPGAVSDTAVVAASGERGPVPEFVSKEYVSSEALPYAAPAGRIGAQKTAGAWSDRHETTDHAGQQAVPMETATDQQPAGDELEKERARTFAEEELRIAEKARMQAEEKQKADETARLLAEQERKAAEEARIAQENEQREQDRAAREQERMRAQEEARRSELAEKERAAALIEAEQRSMERLQAEKDRMLEEVNKRLQAERDARARERISMEQEKSRPAATRPPEPAARAATAVAAQKSGTSSGVAQTTQTPERSSAVRNILLAASVAAVVLFMIFALRPDKNDRAVIKETAHERTVQADRTEPREEKRPVRQEQEPPLVLSVPKAMPVPEPSVYVVVKGDTLWGIAKRFTGNPLNYPRVAKDNSIATPDLIFPGQRIRLKKE